jgi:DNA-directed RNA polymerase sigma subunit (sigma70/sigma32)
MSRSTLPLQPSDDGWPYPDPVQEVASDDEVDLDVLELQADRHLWDTLTASEREAVLRRFGLFDGRARSMKELAHELSITHVQARDLLDAGLDKIRHRLAALDEE